MRISMRGDYALRALTDLAIHYGQGPVQSSEIAGRQAIPEPYLDQLMTLLRKAGFIRSTRGPQGGHVLARPPDEISMNEVVVALEGPLSPVACLDDPEDCGLVTACGQREVWQEVQEATQQILQRTTIAELVRRQQMKERRGMYYI